MVPARQHDHQRPLRPDFSLSYTEVFDVRGAPKKLGVALTASYQEVLSPFDSDFLQYQNTTADVAYLNNYFRLSGYNNRMIKAVSATLSSTAPICLNNSVKA